MGNSTNAKKKVVKDSQKVVDNADSASHVQAMRIATNLYQLMFGNADNKPDIGFVNSLEDHIAQIEKLVEDSTPTQVSMKDSYGNPLTATGTDDKVKRFSHYGFDNNTLNFMLWLSLYNDSWVFKQIIDRPAQDIVRAGFKLKKTDDVKDVSFDKVYETVQSHSEELINVIRWGRLFGGSIGWVQFDSFEDDDYNRSAKENASKLKKATTIKIYVTDRWYGLQYDTNDLVTEMTDQDFGKPKNYTITYANNTKVTVHHDYILRFEGRTAPPLVKNGFLQGWGYAEGSHIIAELSRDDQLKTSVTSLVNKALIEVIKMDGMRGIFMGVDNENEEQLRKRLEMVTWARTYNSLTFLDSEDDYQEHGFGGLGGLADLIDKNMTLVAAAAEMPGILYGDTSRGFANDKDALKRYANVILGYSESQYRPILKKFLWLIYKIYDIKDTIKFDFISLDKDSAELERLEFLSKVRNELAGLLQDGIITPSKYAELYNKASKSGKYEFDITEEYIKKLDEVAMEEAEL